MEMQAGPKTSQICIQIPITRRLLRVCKLCNQQSGYVIDRDTAKVSFTLVKLRIALKLSEKRRVIRKKLKKKREERNLISYGWYY